MAIDYVTNEGLSDEDGLNARIMLTEGDPLTFKQAANKIKVEDNSAVDMSGKGKKPVLYTSILLSLTRNIWKELNDKGVSI